jgi:hypothetical protein
MTGPFERHAKPSPCEAIDHMPVSQLLDNWLRESTNTKHVDDSCSVLGENDAMIHANPERDNDKGATNKMEK